MLKDASQDPAGLARALGSAEFHQVIGRWEPAGSCWNLEINQASDVVSTSFFKSYFFGWHT